MFPADPSELRKTFPWVWFSQAHSLNSLSTEESTLGGFVRMLARRQEVFHEWQFPGLSPPPSHDPGPLAAAQGNIEGGAFPGYWPWRFPSGREVLSWVPREFAREPQLLGYDKQETPCQSLNQPPGTPELRYL